MSFLGPVARTPSAMQCSNAIAGRVAGRASVPAPRATRRVAGAAPAAAAARRVSSLVLPPPVVRRAGTSARPTLPALRAAQNGGTPAVTVIPGDYRIGATLLGVSFFLGPVCHLWTQFLLHGLLGGFLSFQASRVRFRFTETNLEVVFVEPFAPDAVAAAADVGSSGDNKLQGGGANSWALSSITNWEFWWPGFPVLVYFRETQTKADGQPHFFPIIMDGRQLYTQMLARMPPSVNAKPPLEAWCLDTALEATPVGRAIKAKLEPEQLQAIKEMKGLPLVDN